MEPGTFEDDEDRRTERTVIGAELTGRVNGLRLRAVSFAAPFDPRVAAYHTAIGNATLCVTAIRKATVGDRRIHVLVRERHPIQRAFCLAACERAVRSLGSSQGFVLLDAYECVDGRLPASDPFKHPSRQLGRGERAAAEGACDLGKRQLGRILHRPISRRCTAAKLAGSVSSDRSIFAAAKRAAVGATARAMRSASIGASGTRAAVAMAASSFSR